MGFRFLSTWVGCVVLLLGSVTASANGLLDRARALHNSGKAQEAYELLLPAEEQRAGEVAFDYLLGITAIDSGHTLQALFALERVVGNQPDNDEARAELGRAYFLLGDSEAAKREFDRVAAHKPPKPVMATINEYLSAVEDRMAAAGEQFWGYVEIGLGHDSNVNSATNASRVAVPVLSGIVTLDAAGRETDSWFTEAKGGIRFSAPIRSDLRFFVNGDFKAHTNLGESFDQDTIDGSLGLQLFKGKDKYTLTLQGQKFLVDDTRNRHVAGLNGQWQHTVDDSNQFTMFAQYADITYPNQKVRNMRRHIAGVAWGHAFDWPGTPVVFVSAYGGGEDQENTDIRDDLDRDIWGVRIGGQYNLSPKAALFANVAYEDSFYDTGEDPIFFVNRKDKYVNLTAGLNYQWNKHLRIMPQVQYTDNDSNIVISDFDRVVAQVNARWDFR